MRGERCDDVRVPPVGVVPRGSTQPAAVDDPDVAAAVAFIRDHTHLDLDVGRVVRHVGVSRRTLETAFRKHLDRTPGQEIRRVRLDNARRLLRTTQQPIGRIALTCGFSDVRTFSTVFRQHEGRTPTDYRNRRDG